MEECFDGLARITSKELALIHSVKNGILQNICSTSRVNTFPPNTENGYGKFYMKTMATVYSYEKEVNQNCSITSKTGTTRTPTSRPQSTTPMTTLTSTIAWRTCIESARTAHLFHSCECLTLHSPCLKSEHFHISIHDHLHGAFSLILLLPFLLHFPPVCPRLPLPPRAVH